MIIPPTSGTRQFLARVMAWPQEGEPLAYVNIHNTFVPEDTSKLKTKPNGTPMLPWSGRACRSLDEAVKAVEYCKTTPSTKDVYFCTSTQAFAEEKVSKKGFIYYKAQRAAENAVRMKALFIDSDLVDGKADASKGYANKTEFGMALVEFLKATGLPRPTMIVQSGGGFHMYWTLVRALTVTEWMPMAYALAEATKRHGFKCDPQCTIDSARVLRVPGTKNYKYDPPRDVTLAGNPIEHDYGNEKLLDILKPYAVQVPYTMLHQTMSILPPKTPLQGMSELSAGIDASGAAPVKLDSLVFTCGFIAEALATGGAGFQNPLWNLTTLIATFTEGGRADAHRMASGHTSYGPGETDELFDRKVQEKLTKNMGWPKCAAISASGCTACAICPKFAENKSPLNFADKVTNNVQTAAMQGGFSQPVTIQGNLNPSNQQNVATFVPGAGRADPDLPPGYLRNPNGVILMAQPQDDGTTTWFPLTRYPMIDPWLQRDPWSLNFTTETEFGKTSIICVPLDNVGTGEMKKELQSQGFMVMGGPRGFNNLVDFLMAWITKLQSTKDAIITSVPFGWLTRGGTVKGFVYGGKLHTPQGEEIASNTDPELARQFSPEGDKLPWIAAAQMITNQKRPALDAILASSFAGPLVRFTGHSGLLLSAYSVESGIGKSTALKIAQAVWGDPVKAIQSLSDTQNSVLNKLGELRSLPMYWDELKSDDDAKRFVETVFRLTLGKEKSRMTSKVTQRTPGTWQTIMVAASNESLMDAVTYKTRATTAGLYRVFEYTVSKPVPGAPGQIDPTLAQRLTSKLHDNYGVVGLEYASYLGRNHQQVEKDIGAVLSSLGKEVGMGADERFWVSLMAVILLGARYANHLGFTKIDEAGLKTFLIRTLHEMRTNRSAQPVDMRSVSNIVNTLARFLNENRARHTIYTNILHQGRGKPMAGSVIIKEDATKLDAIRVHVGLDDRKLRIGQSYLFDWLAQNNYPRHVFVKALNEELKAVFINGRLGAGTSFAGASEYLIEINLTNTPLANFIDEA